MTRPDPTRPDVLINPAWILAALVLAITASNVMVFWLFEDRTLPESLALMLGGALIFEPMLFGIWAAFGPGQLAIRLPLLLPTLMIAISGPNAAGIHEAERLEFIVMVIVGFVIFAATMVLLLVFRSFVPLTIKRRAGGPTAAPRLQFNIKYLMVLITLCAVALGMVSNIRFKEPVPNPFFGPYFYVNIMIVGGGLVAGTVLPVLVVPMLILSDGISTTTSRRLLAAWATVNVISIVVWMSLDADNAILLVLLLQLGAAIAGGLAGAAFRCAGYRLDRPPDLDDAPRLNRDD